MTSSFKLIIVLILLPIINLSAQSTKVNKAIKGFCETEFMTTFKEMKMEAESSVRSFKVEQRRYDSYDVNRVREAYDETARELNKVLYRIRDDFMDRRKMKYINEYPEDYTRALKGEMQELQDYFANNFQSKMADVRDEVGFISIVMDVIRAAREVTSYIRSIKKSARQFKEEQLQELLIDPYRFRLWHEIGNERENSYYNEEYNNDYEEDYYDEEDEEDYYEEDEYGSSKGKRKKIKKKKKPSKITIPIPSTKKEQRDTSKTKKNN